MPGWLQDRGTGFIAGIKRAKMARNLAQADEFIQRLRGKS
jgi:hypothetical protein